MGRLAAGHWTSREAAERWARKRIGDARFELARRAFATASRYMGPDFRPFMDRQRELLRAKQAAYATGDAGRVAEFDERLVDDARRTMVKTGFTAYHHRHRPGALRRAVLRLILMDDPDFPLTPTVMAYIGISEGIDPPATEGAFGDEWLTAAEMFKRRSFQRWQNLIRPGVLGLLDP